MPRCDNLTTQCVGVIVTVARHQWDGRLVRHRCVIATTYGCTHDLNAISRLS